ncbi:hypothetical protein FJY69_10160, partial [candidate division WOR-3 bacterium]|nr:hypothetical protein [candidate division WOR-3 bacterium]
MTPRMSLITLLLVLAAGSALAQPMNGTYTVKIDGSGDFPSPMAAGAALNSRGISGHVVIDIYTGVYEQSSYVYLNSVSGASSYTITFKAATGQSVEITAPSYVFYGYYTPNVKVKGVTLRAASYGCYAFYNCHNWKIENCVIRSGSIGIYFDYYCNNESIIGNDIRAPSVGLYTYGYST